MCVCVQLYKSRQNDFRFGVEEALLTELYRVQMKNSFFNIVLSAVVKSACVCAYLVSAYSDPLPGDIFICSK